LPTVCDPKFGTVCPTKNRCFYTGHFSFLGRPTYVSADLCFTGDSFFLLSFFFRRLISELTERIHIWPHGRK